VYSKQRIEANARKVIHDRMNYSKALTKLPDLNKQLGHQQQPQKKQTLSKNDQLMLQQSDHYDRIAASPDRPTSLSKPFAFRRAEKLHLRRTALYPPLYTIINHLLPSQLVSSSDMNNDSVLRRWLQPTLIDVNENPAGNEYRQNGLETMQPPSPQDLSKEQNNLAENITQSIRNLGIEYNLEFTPINQRRLNFKRVILDQIINRVSQHYKAIFVINKTKKDVTKKVLENFSTKRIMKKQVSESKAKKQKLRAIQRELESNPTYIKLRPHCFTPSQLAHMGWFYAFVNSIISKPHHLNSYDDPDVNFEIIQHHHLTGSGRSGTKSRDSLESANISRAFIRRFQSTDVTICADTSAKKDYSGDIRVSGVGDETSGDLGEDNEDDDASSYLTMTVSSSSSDDEDDDNDNTNKPIAVEDDMGDSDETANGKLQTVSSFVPLNAYQDDDDDDDDDGDFSLPEKQSVLTEEEELLLLSSSSTTPRDKTKASGYDAADDGDDDEFSSLLKFGDDDNDDDDEEVLLSIGKKQ
jgi:hypothetical protein